VRLEALVFSNHSSFGGALGPLLEIQLYLAFGRSVYQSMYNRYLMESTIVLDSSSAYCYFSLPSMNAHE
jgi:hypothetical protein